MNPAQPTRVQTENWKRPVAIRPPVVMKSASDGWTGTGSLGAVVDRDSNCYNSRSGAESQQGRPTRRDRREIKFPLDHDAAEVHEHVRKDGHGGPGKPLEAISDLH
jgi:hypothetical protein